MKKLFSFTLFVCISFIAKAQPNIAPGLVILNTCNNEGPTHTYLLEQNIAIEVQPNRQAITYIALGTWQLKKDKFTVQCTTLYDARIYNEGLTGIFTKYKARKRKVKYKSTVNLAYMQKAEGTCLHYNYNEYTNATVHDFLRLEMPNQYPYTMDRLMTEEEKSNLTSAELRIAYNEILARYGYIFEDSDLKKLFLQRHNYKELLHDVDAFISPIEKQNLELLKAYK